MNHRAISLAAALFCFASFAAAQSGTLASSIGVFVFPRNSQDADEQARDEAECFQWTVDQTGSDPFLLERQAATRQASADRSAQQVESAGRGSAASGALIGAATGAVVGNVFGRSSRSRQNMRMAGAAIGASQGAAGRAQAQAQAQAGAQRAADRLEVTEQELDAFRTAFSTCMEANEYVARF